MPSHEILSGGPPRDGIPSIDRPRFVVAKEADLFVGDRDRILGNFHPKGEVFAAH